MNKLKLLLIGLTMNGICVAAIFAGGNWYGFGYTMYVIGMIFSIIAILASGTKTFTDLLSKKWLPGHVVSTLVYLSGIYLMVQNGDVVFAAIAFTIEVFEFFVILAVKQKVAEDKTPTTGGEE